MARPISSAVAALIALCGCAFFFSVIISPPVNNTIYFAAIRNATTGYEVARFGLFGDCWQFSPGGDMECSKRRLGWHVNEERLGITIFPHSLAIISRISRGLAINLLAVAFSGVSTIIWLVAFLFEKRSNYVRIPAFMAYVIALIFAWIAFSINIGVTDYLCSAVTRHSAGAWTGAYGSGVWITFVGAVFFSFAIVSQIYAARWCCFRHKPDGAKTAVPKTLPIPDSDFASSTSLNRRRSAPDEYQMKQRKSV